MKKFLSVIICILLISISALPVYAATDKISVTATSDTTAVESTSELTVALSDGVTVTATEIEISVICSKQLEAVSGKFILADTKQENINFENRPATAVAEYDTPTEIAGNLFSFTVKGLEVSENRTVQVTVSAKNGNSNIFTKTVKYYINVICKEHTFTEWKTLKSADCENAGEQTRSCKECSYTETQTVEPLGHNFADMTVLRAATCTEKGYERGFCSRCKQKLLQEIPPKGHDMSEFTTVTEPTCTEKGTEISKCKNCDETETREIEALGHEFQDAVITTEPTLGKTGIATGYCTRCSETTTQEVQCGHNDAATGIKIKTVYGVYPEDTKIKIVALTGGSDYDFIANALAHITNRFTGYTISTTHRGFNIDANGEVTALFPIPTEYVNSATVYFISNDGTVKKLSAQIGEDGTTATVKFCGSGYYAVCKTGFAAGIKSAKTGKALKICAIVLLSLTVIICWLIVALQILKTKKPSLYNKLIAKIPTYSQIRLAVRRYIFIFKESIKKPRC